MGTEFEIDLNKYDCSCFKGEDGFFLDFANEMKNYKPFSLFGTSGKSSTASELQENTPGGIHYPNDNIVKSRKKKKIYENNINSFICSESESEINNSNNINSNNKLNDQDQKRNDIKEFDKNTDYFQLANQINNAIIELKMNLYTSQDEIIKPTPTPTPMESGNSNGTFNFQKIIKKAGKSADKICFNDIIWCIKRISDINSQIILNEEKIYLGIVSKFKKEKNDKYLINYEDKEKIIDLPNFDDIKESIRVKLGDKFNNPKFKFNKFSIKGSFPNEILIWNLISQNTRKIADILTDNYYCCLVLLYFSKVEEENETIMYLINKPTE